MLIRSPVYPAARLVHRRSAMRPLCAVVAAALLLSCGGDEPSPATPVAKKVNRAPTLTKPQEAPPATPNRLPPIDRDLPAILEKKELAVLFTYNSTGYFIYRGATMGYEYELLSMFAREHGLRLRPVVVRDSRELFEQLDRGEGDVIAAQLAEGTDRTQVGVTEPLYETAPVVVQRSAASPAAGKTPTVTKSLAREAAATQEAPFDIRARPISTPRELAGQPVHLTRSSPYRARLLELNVEMTNDIEVIEVDESADRLIQRLADGDIRYTVTAENLAALRAGEYSNLVIKPTLGPPEPVVWGVRTNALQLNAELNRWIAAKRKSGLLRVLYKKYFLDRRGFDARAASRYLTAETGELSPWDDAFREWAKVPGWDWRLVAAQAYQESRFNPNAKSWAGAVGLMQMMPRTARELRVKDPRDPAQSIEAACRYLWKLDSQLADEIPNEPERRKFILASYNVGLGHVSDARRLAAKNGDDPNKWSDVAYWLIRKSKRNVYNDPVVKYGYARGTEPVAYVDLILDRFEHYKQFVAKEKVEAEALTPEEVTP
jgi:membrane-bound lytic murein transglycosylase F